jgi:SAM-dependent methyltransferase
VSTLPLTGERTLPGVAQENYWFRRHEAAYRWVARHLDLPGRRVVDAGVGEGYGGQALSEAGAAAVLGLDLDHPTLRHVARTYPGVAVARANLVALPLRDSAVEIVVSSQVVEHLWDQDRFVAECSRVLRPGGHLVVTTPNRRTFPPGNPFHSRELDADELATLLDAHLAVAGVHGVHHGPRLAGLDAEQGGLVAAQLASGPEAWGPALLDAVASVTADDFVVGGADGCLDLVAVGVRR